MQRSSIVRISILVVAVAAILAYAPVASAQSDARLAIKVMDPEGNPIPGAQVQVVSTTQGGEREFVTDEDGEYLQRGFRPDTYVLTVRAEGYQPQQQQIDLDFGMNAIDVVLPPVTGPTAADAEALNATYQTGYQAFQQGEYQTAADSMTELLDALTDLSGEEVDEVRASAYNILAAARMSLEEPEAAIEAYEKLRELRPRSSDALIGLGQAYARIEDFETSLEYFRQALELSPEDPVAHFNTGVLMIQVDQLEEGIGILEKATELRPEFPLAYKRLGYAYARNGDYEGAVQAFQTYLEQSPDAPDRADIEGMVTALEAEAARQQAQQEQQER